MAPTTALLIICLFKALLMVLLVKSEGTKTGLVSIDRCNDTQSTSRFFACKLDKCNKWISFVNCQENLVSTGLLNLAQKYVHCTNSSAIANSVDDSHGLFPKSMCFSFQTLEGWSWCEYEQRHCWFSFKGCDDNEIETDYLNFGEMTVDCRPVNQATSYPADLASTSLSTFPSAQKLVKAGQSSVHWNVILFHTLAFWLIIVLA